jgi:signal transduction histidine kinase/ActR/RegA family two-component response regulator
MILIVDDRQENIFSLRTVLLQYGFAIDTALSGEEALRKLLKNEYALVILDVQMPGMDGFEVAEAITGLKKTKDIPIIFLSAVNTHKRFITKGFEAGAVEYLTKPVDPDILILKVQNFYRLYEKTKALKDAEQALARTVDELYVTLEALPQIAFVTNQKGELEYVNKPWLSYAASEKSFPAVQPGEVPFPEQWAALISEEKPVEKELMIGQAGSDIFHYHLLKATPILVNGEITRWVGTLTNIHQQKVLNELLEQKVAERTRELLEANRELAISNNELQQFTSVASHDLKEPLRKILFFGSLIGNKAALTEETKAYLEKIMRASRRMNDLIEDLLSFASLAGPNLFQPTDANLIISDILLDLELSIAEKNADVKIISPLPVLEAIPALLRQLFQNIISNALKFAQAGVAPVVTIAADRVDIPSVEAKPADSGVYCRIAVADNGIGFEEKYAEKIFTIFQRLNTRTEYEGTGIGLAIAKKIIDRHNGAITAHSRPGEGSVFYLFLPVKQEPVHKSREENHFATTLLS